MKIKKDGESLISLNRINQARKKQIYNINEPDKLLEFINNNLKHKEIEKKERGEVFTPMSLVNEMLDKLPKLVWKNKDFKWLDPCAGMGNFPVVIYLRLMEGLKEEIKEEEERRKHILENMLYMVEINKKNVFLLKKILCNNTYKLNIFEGSFIDYKDFEKVNIKNIKEFDIILGNPPYNASDSNGNILWDKFIRQSFKILKNKGYFLFITPPLWRKPQGEKSKTNDLYELMVKNNNLIYLEMHDMKDGLNIFKAGTRYDFYLIKKENNKDNKTLIKDIEGKSIIINTKEWEFIPNKSFNLIKKIIANPKEKTVQLLYNRENDKQKSHININKNNIYKYPIIYTTPKSGINYIYSSKKDVKSFFNIPKVIIGETGYEKAILDLNGDYGTSELSLGLKIKNKQEGLLIEKALNTDKFKEILFESLTYSQYRINRNIFKIIKEDFYNYFI